jgi:hypothetical protein
MTPERQCFFHRNPDSLRIGIGIGYCDSDNTWVICDGDRKFCENPDALVCRRPVSGRPQPLDHNCTSTIYLIPTLFDQARQG